MVNAALDFDARYEDLEQPLFISDKDNVRLMWEYINMGFQYICQKKSLRRVKILIK